MEKKPLHPIDKEIIRALIGTKVKVTPSQISKAIGIHPKTAQDRLREMQLKGLIKCNKKGNRTYCQTININQMKKKLMDDFFFG
jgi:predicted transcriptional regulator